MSGEFAKSIMCTAEAYEVHIHQEGYECLPEFRLLVPVTDDFETPFHVTMGYKSAPDGGEPGFFVESLKLFFPHEIVDGANLQKSSRMGDLSPEKPMTFLCAHPTAKFLGYEFSEEEAESQIEDLLGDVSDDRGLFGKTFCQLLQEHGEDELHGVLGLTEPTSLKMLRQHLYGGWLEEACKYFVNYADEWYLVSCSVKTSTRLSSWPYWAQSGGSGYIFEAAAHPKDRKGKRVQGSLFPVNDAMGAIRHFQEARNKQFKFSKAVEFDGDIILKKAIAAKMGRAVPYLPETADKFPKIVYAMSDVAVNACPNRPVVYGKVEDIYDFFLDDPQFKHQYYYNDDHNYQSMDEIPSTVVGVCDKRPLIAFTTKVIGGLSRNRKDKVWNFLRDEYIVIYTKYDPTCKDFDGEPSPQLQTVLELKDDWEMDRMLLSRSSSKTERQAQYTRVPRNE